MGVKLFTFVYLKDKEMKQHIRTENIKTLNPSGAVLNYPEF